MLRPLFFSLTPFVAPLIVGAGFAAIPLTPWAAFAGVGLLLFLHPLLDAALGTADATPARLPGWFYTALLWLYAFVQLGMLAWTLATLVGLPAFGAAWTGKMLSTGILGGALGITVAHELIHRRRRAERGLGLVLLLTVSYAHYRVEHVFGHHRYVGTRHDPGTARATDSIYAYWRRALPGEWRNAWRIERDRVAAGRGPWRSHRILHYLAAQAAIMAALAWGLGLAGLLFFLGQSLVAILLLEGVAYIEHWGIERRELAPGRFEAVTAAHAWDTRHRATNSYLFNLGRHAHHHLKAAAPYQSLTSLADARQLPYGYSTMLLIALWPPLWRAVMSPK